MRRSREHSVGHHGVMVTPPQPFQSDDPPLPSSSGLHHIPIPVRDPEASCDGYVRVLGFEPLMELEEEKGVVGAVLRHSQGLVVGLHRDVPRATALSGFAVLGIGVENRGQLGVWAATLDRLGLSHGDQLQGHLGWYMDVADPDGIVIRFHAGPDPFAEEA